MQDHDVMEEGKESEKEEDVQQSKAGTVDGHGREQERERQTPREEANEGQ